MPKGQYLHTVNAERSELRRQAQLANYEVIKSGCWIWQSGTSPDGYGKVKRFGKTIRAHRMFFEHHVGEVPSGMWVLHKCDTPLCVNPEHLWLGTQIDNERDKDRKGRRPLPTRTKYVEFKGEIRTLKAWAAHLGVNVGSLSCRFIRGWDVHRAFTHPFNASDSQRISQAERIANGTLVKSIKGQYQGSIA